MKADGGELAPKIIEFLQDPLVTSLLAVHPNTVLSSNRVPKIWDNWWNWVAANPTDNKAPWLSLLQYYTETISSERVHKSTESLNKLVDYDYRLSEGQALPPDLVGFLQRASSLQLDRTPVQLPASENAIASKQVADGRFMQGMSPKKAHEVSRMTNYINHITTTVPELRHVKHIVDVGAGQGYLSRALCDLGFHVLALDGDAGQTEGARRRDDVKCKGSQSGASHLDINQEPKGTLTHKTLHINSSTLKDAVSTWVDDRSSTGDEHAVPVLFVALHACGSLTPDIFRAFVDLQRSEQGKIAEKWSPAGAVIVGCCYNLMDPTADFPLSQAFAPCPRMTPTHLQLATQMPSHWLDSPSSRKSAELAVKKVVYRALLEPFLQIARRPSAEASTGTDAEPRKTRIGRLPDRVYTSFPDFCSHAFARLGLDSSAYSFDTLHAVDGEPPMSLEETQRRLEVLHTLRCIVGPCIESLILLDRLTRLREALGCESVDDGLGGWDVGLVGLFDQALGSARNFALVVVPTCKCE